jgi:transposase
MMSVRKEYTSEFRGQAVRFVFESIELDETRKEACRRLAPKLNVNHLTLYGWVKSASPMTTKSGGVSLLPGSVEDLRAQVQALRRENRELVRANTILQDAAVFFGAALDRQSRK